MRLHELWVRILVCYHVAKTHRTRGHVVKKQCIDLALIFKYWYKHELR